MATFSNPSDGFYDHTSGPSPQGMRSSTLSRHNTRPMEGYNTMHGSMFGSGAGGTTMRYDGMRESFGPPMQGSAMGNNHFPYDVGAAQTWNAGLMQYNNSNNNNNNMNAMSQDNYGPARSVKPSRGRSNISNLWDYGPSSGPTQMQPPPLPMSGTRQPSQTGRADGLDDDELIPTAIVIKNIPFAVKKEQLVQLMVELSLPLPYAFNYHFDNGVFRGLAFANFTSPSETESVIQALNHLELSGRKLRVEYKKMLPLAERERIEREKRERRGQLEEQHRPLPQSQLHNQLSMSSISRNTPSPLSHRSNAARPGQGQGQGQGQNLEFDMNDPATLDFYTQLAVFKNGTEPETLIFSQDLEPHKRRIIHTLAHHMGLLHISHGVGEQRQVHVKRPPPGSNVSPTNALANAFGNNKDPRQNMGRSSNADFHEGRPLEGPSFSTLRGQSSVGLLDVTDNNAFGNAANSNLRNAKSFADLRSWSPSPAPSSASFHPEVRNGARLQAGVNDTASSNTPTLTPTASNPTIGMERAEPFLISGFNGLNVGSGNNAQTSPRRQRNPFSGTPWDDQSYQGAGTIGSKRAVSIGGENANPVRQSRGPTSNNAIGFRRQNGRGSDELRTAASAIAE